MKAKLRTLFGIALAFRTSVVFPQSILNNGGFEQYVELPDYYGQLNRATGWSNTNGYYPDFNNCPFPLMCATPDFFHAFGLTTVNGFTPFSHNILPHSGNGWSYFVSCNVGADSSLIPFHEYISSELLSSTMIDSAYTVEFYLSLGNFTDSTKCHYAANNVGVLFSTIQPTQVSNEYLNWTPQINISEIITDTNWRNYQFFIVADSAYQYVTIGNFLRVWETETIMVWTCDSLNPNNIVSPGYFLDDISITAIGSASVSAGSLSVGHMRMDEEALIIQLSRQYARVELTIRDMAGVEIKTKRFRHTDRLEINISGISGGVYSVSIANEMGSWNSKIVVP